MADMKNQIVYKNTRFKIKTHEGFKSFVGLMVGENSHKLKLTFSNGASLTCSPKHKFTDVNDNEIYAENIIIGETVLWGDITVTNIDTCEDNRKIYDFLEVSDNHSYLANNILSKNCVILDEFAYVPKNIADSFFSSVYPVVSTDPNSHVIIVSTANTSVDNMYYDIWQQALSADKTDPEQWQAFRMDWWEVPGRDEKWKQDQIASIGIERFRIEFGNEFISRSATRLLPDSIIEAQRMIERNPLKLVIKSLSSETNWVFNIYHRFEYGHVYVAGADIAEGVGGDASSLVILDITDMTNIKLALSFKSSVISINEFAALSARILNCYCLPLILAENNGVGAGYLSVLKEIYGYPKILSFNGTSLGIHSATASKLNACLWLRELMTTEEINFKLYDQDLIGELSVFSKSTGRNVINYSAPKNLHDDFTMALIWAVLLIKPEHLKFGVNVLKTVKTKLGVEIPSVISIDALSAPSLLTFASDKLPYVVSTMTADVEANWFSTDDASVITTSVQIFEPTFFVHNDLSDDLNADFDDSTDPSW